MSGTVVLAVVAHPDDEVLGAGGTLARHRQRGDQVRVVFLADGVSSRGSDTQAAERRIAAARKANSVLGAGEPGFLGLPDNKLDTLPLLDIVKALEAVIAEINPDTIYTHHAGDLNIDHVICHRAVMTACRPLPGTRVDRILAMEVASSTEWAPHSASVFNPTCFVDISATMDLKRRALEAYGEEMRDFPHARSYQALEAVAHCRGASVGLAAAEAFMVLREIVR
jgi:LmbE family N-acetylglucosaminyl deacetylase